MCEDVHEGARKVWGIHGYAFQYAVLRRAKELAEAGKSRWGFEVAEFPVGQLEAGTHIDFVLTYPSPRVYMVAECKRSDPKRSIWCFTRAPETRPGAMEREVVFQRVYRQAGSPAQALTLTKVTEKDACHLGIELKSNRLGDGAPTHEAIKSATAQVLRGTNGLVDHLFSKPRKMPQEELSAVFLPVIFTTARLYVTDGDLSDADLADGTLPGAWGSSRAVPWLWYTHNQSRDLRHHLGSAGADGSFDLAAVLHAESSRSVAIVGPDGIEPFLRAPLGDWMVSGW